MSAKVHRVCPYCGKIPAKYMKHLRAKHGVTAFNKWTKGAIVSEMPESRPKHMVELPEITV